VLPPNNMLDEFVFEKREVLPKMDVTDALANMPPLLSDFLTSKREFEVSVVLADYLAALSRGRSLAAVELGLDRTLLKSPMP
jgi:hypothetical protein